MPPALPAMRVTMPSIPVYGGPVERLPPPPEARPKVFSGKVAAAAIFMVFAALVIAAIILLKWLSGPS